MVKNWINKNYKTLIISAFLIPIITVAIVSISHVTLWYGISNPVTWSVYLSIGIEIAALSALAAISADMGSKVYFPFAIVTLIQFIGNIFFAYSYIDVNSQLFKDWVDLVSPLVEFIGVESGDMVGHKRFLALFAGGMLPIISLSFLHMLVKFTEEDRIKQNPVIENKKKEENQEKEIEKEENEDPVLTNFIKHLNTQKEETPTVDAKDIVSEVSRLRLSEGDLKRLEEVLLNPPPPNEALINAAKKYLETISIEDESIIDEFKVKEEIVNNTPTSVEEKVMNIKQVVFEPIIKKELTHEERGKILSEMMQRDQELGLYDEPYNNSTVEEPSVSPQNAQEMMLTTDDDIIMTIPPDDEISDWDIIPSDNGEINQITPALSDEEVREMFMDEWERKFDTIEEEPTINDENENFTTVIPEFLDNLQENNSDFIPPVDVAVDNQPEISEEEKQINQSQNIPEETITSNIETIEEKKN